MGPNTPTRDSPSAEVATRAVGRVVVFAVCATAALTLAVGLSRTVYPHDVGQYDASIWAPADLIAHGHSPYFRSTALAPSYVVAPYGPVYYGVIALGLRSFGQQFWFGRVLTILCLGVCALLVYAVLHRAAAPAYGRLIAVVGAGLLFAQYPVQAFIGTQRPDLIALALALSGLSLAFRDTAESGKRVLLRAAGAGVLLALAILVRQTLFLPLLVGLTWFALRRDGARFVATFLAAATTLAAAVGFLMATSDGDFLWHAVRLQTSVPFSAQLALDNLGGFVLSPATLFTLAMLALGVIWNLRLRSRGPASGGVRPELQLLRRLFLAYLAVAVAVAAVASGKAGSNVNYWFEVALLLSILTPLVWARTLDTATAPESSLAVLSSLVVVTLVAALATGAREAHGQILYWRALPYTNEVVSKLRSITSTAQPVIADYPDIAVSAGRSYYFNDIATYRLSPLLAPLELRVERSKRIKAIATLATSPPAGYVAVCLTHSAPSGVYAIRLYELKAGARLATTRCAIA